MNKKPFVCVDHERVNHLKEKLCRWATKFITKFQRDHQSTFIRRIGNVKQDTTVTSRHYDTQTEHRLQSLNEMNEKSKTENNR